MTKRRDSWVPITYTELVKHGHHSKEATAAIEEVHRVRAVGHPEPTIEHNEYRGAYRVRDPLADDR